jgi:hypothetical protein
LVAAGIDYLCHRRTAIEKTAGWRESALHVLQYLCVAPTVVMAALFTMSGVMLWFAAAAMLIHSVLAYVDVRYTISRRFISPLEQHVHGVLTVVPPIAVTLLALADIDYGAEHASLRAAAGLSTLQLVLIIGTTAVLGGIPVIEEGLRTIRMRGATSQSPTSESTTSESIRSTVP